MARIRKITVPDSQRKTIVENAKRLRGRSQPGLPFGKRCEYKGDTYLVVELDADDDVRPEGYTLRLLADDGDYFLMGVPPSAVKYLRGRKSSQGETKKSFRAPRTKQEIIDILEEWQGDITQAPRREQLRLRELVHQLEDKGDIREVQQHLKLMRPLRDMDPNSRREFQKLFSSRIASAVMKLAESLMPKKARDTEAEWNRLFDMLEGAAKARDVSECTRLIRNIGKLQDEMIMDFSRHEKSREISSVNRIHHDAIRAYADENNFDVPASDATNQWRGKWNRASVIAEQMALAITDGYNDFDAKTVGGIVKLHRSYVYSFAREYSATLYLKGFSTVEEAVEVMGDFARRGKADETFVMIRGKYYTPGETSQMTDAQMKGAQIRLWWD